MEAFITKILVTGSTGLLAKGLEETAPQGAQLIGIHLRKYQLKESPTRHLEVDIRDAEAVRSLILSERPEAVIHAAGIASVDQVERNPAEGLASNLQGTINVAKACREAGSYLVYISTNAVFDGHKAPYRESDAVSPAHEYGRIKVRCEQAVEQFAGEHSIVRPILMYGWNHIVNRPNPVSWIHQKLKRGERVPLVDDVYENPLYNLQCGRALWAVVERKPRGIFHLAGADRVNRHELGLAIAETFGLDATLIDRVDSSYFPSIAARPPDTTFVTERMEKELNVAPVSLRDGLADMKAALVTL